MSKKQKQEQLEDSVGQYEIEEPSTVPAPVRTRVAKYPWAKIAPCEKDEDGNLFGESFFVQTDKKSFTSSIYSAGKRHGFKFAIRDAEKDGVAGCRVWRIE